MSWLDLTIIYFACGTPLGVYFYFQNRSSGSAIPKACLTTLFWLPFAFKLLQAQVNKRLTIDEFDENSLLDSLRRKIESSFLASGKKDLFSFREILERYIGLTLSVRLYEEAPGRNETNIFSISGHPEEKLGAKCLHRRNHSHLLRHQTLARRDFICAMEQIQKEAGNTFSLKPAFQLASFLGDFEAMEAISAFIGLRDIGDESWKNMIRRKPENTFSIASQAAQAKARE